MLTRYALGLGGVVVSRARTGRRAWVAGALRRDVGRGDGKSSAPVAETSRRRTGRRHGRRSHDVGGTPASRECSAGRSARLRVRLPDDELLHTEPSVRRRQAIAPAPRTRATPCLQVVGAGAGARRRRTMEAPASSMSVSSAHACRCAGQSGPGVQRLADGAPHWPPGTRCAPADDLLLADDHGVSPEAMAIMCSAARPPART